MADFKDCVKFAKANPTCYVATMEGDQPRVRALGLLFADKTGFYFQAYTVKAIYKQLKANPKVEIYFYAPAKEGLGKAMRVSGKVKFIDDVKIRAKCLEDRPFLKLFGIEKPEDPRLLVLQVYTGEAYFWTMADNMKESEIKRIKF